MVKNPFLTAGIFLRVVLVDFVVDFGIVLLCFEFFCGEILAKRLCKFLIFLSFFAVLVLQCNIYGFVLLRVVCIWKFF